MSLWCIHNWRTTFCNYRVHHSEISSIQLNTPRPHQCITLRRLHLSPDLYVRKAWWRQWITTRYDSGIGVQKIARQEARHEETVRFNPWLEETSILCTIFFPLDNVVTIQKQTGRHSQWAVCNQQQTAVSLYQSLGCELQPQDSFIVYISWWPCQQWTRIRWNGTSA